ncbi:hypothetical protein, partial [Luteococcus peritonei]
MSLTTRSARSLAAVALAAGLCLSTPAVGLAAAPAPASAVLVAPAKLAPVDLASRAEAFNARHGLTDVRPAGQVIDPTQYQCDADTDFRRWSADQVDRLSQADLDFLAETAADALPTYDALLFGSSSDQAYSLGQDSQVLTKTFKKLRAFWDINSSDIQLMGMNGHVYSDVARMTEIYQVVFELDAVTAAAYAQYVHDYLASSPTLDADNPLMTLNAFAYSTFGTDPAISDRIIMGAGILQAYDELGYGDVAPQLILAHEFGHHVQFELGMITAETVGEAETTRRTELHADASASYFATHPKGLSMQYKRVQQFLGVFYGIGDCGFTSGGHHGTPNQRRAAADWGYRLQEANRPKSYVHPARTFAELFDRQLPVL